jgi:hypothetical protein
MSQTIITLLQAIQQPSSQLEYRINLTKLFCYIQASPELWTPHELESSPDQEFMYSEALFATWPQLVQSIHQLTASQLMPWFNQQLQESYRVAAAMLDRCKTV